MRIDGTGTLKRTPGLLSVETTVPLKEDSSSGSAVLAIGYILEFAYLKEYFTPMLLYIEQNCAVPEVTIV